MKQASIRKYSARDRIPRHRHHQAYIAVVLLGKYIEAGDQGRVCAEAGDVLIHDAFEAHLNEFGAAGGLVINLPPVRGLDAGSRRVEDLDLIARLAEWDSIAAGLALLEESKPVMHEPMDWPDHVADALEREPERLVANWACELGLAPQSLSRGFKQVFGVTPKRYRADQRALRAVRYLTKGPCKLADVAAVCGFADQAHMSREVRKLTGLSPRELKVQSVQDNTDSWEYGGRYGSTSICQDGILIGDGILGKSASCTKSCGESHSLEGADVGRLRCDHFS
jgi:AraC-like DNA-binding protein